MATQYDRLERREAERAGGTAGLAVDTSEVGVLVREVWRGCSARAAAAGAPPADKGLGRSTGHLALTRWVSRGGGVVCCAVLQESPRRFQSLGCRVRGFSALHPEMRRWVPGLRSRDPRPLAPLAPQDASRPATVDNLVLLTQAEADAHDDLPAAGGGGEECGLEALRRAEPAFCARVEAGLARARELFLIDP